MLRAAAQLRQDALGIWQAGVDAVRSDRLVRLAVRVEGPYLVIDQERLELAAVARIVVVGAGKAGAGMAAGLEEALGEKVLAEKRVTGWINVPDDCLRPTSHIHLHPARPAGPNEPTAQGVAGADEILRLAGSLEPDDLCLCLLSGGASALAPAPAAGISLADKLALTRWLSDSGANIAELNMVRRQLSRIKGGGLARACRAGRLITLVISDVLGDPLDVIGSGPTAEDTGTAEAALAVLARYDARRAGIPEAVFEHLERGAARRQAGPACRVTHVVIGNNATAVEAAGARAQELGYRPALVAGRELEGAAEQVGRELAAMAVSLRDLAGPDCLVAGGEPVVTLVEPDRRGRGGRNQQLALSALAELAGNDGTHIAIVSGGTDGEDGPTDAAGAIVDADIIAAASRQGLEPADYLNRNDAYHFFEPLGGLIKTGPTHTNVCDLRIVVVNQIGRSSGVNWP